MRGERGWRLGGGRGAAEAGAAGGGGAHRAVEASILEAGALAGGDAAALAPPRRPPARPPGGALAHAGHAVARVRRAAQAVGDPQVAAPAGLAAELARDAGAVGRAEALAERTRRIRRGSRA